MIGAVILAAGQSRRMGRPKLVLPWGERTVIEQVVVTIHEAGLSTITIVTGAAHEAIAKALCGYSVTLEQNPNAERYDMLPSMQVGIAAQPEKIAAVLVFLGDQPRITADVVKQVIECHLSTGARLVAPSYLMRRGHPWLVERSLWPELLAMDPEQNMRDFLNRHKDEIAYVDVQTDCILRDMDTPEDYEREKPATS